MESLSDGEFAVSFDDSTGRATSGSGCDGSVSIGYIYGRMNGSIRNYCFFQDKSELCLAMESQQEIIIYKKFIGFNTEILFMIFYLDKVV